MKYEKKPIFIFPLLISFLLMSFYHSFELAQTLAVNYRVYSSHTDVFLIGLILFVIATAFASPLIVWTMLSINKWGWTKKNTAQLNGISLLYAVIFTAVMIDLTENFYEGSSFVASYFFIFLILLNTYIFLWKSFSSRK